MDEKESTDNGYAPHDEKEAHWPPEPEMADPAGRRMSVALNIVENPLKVSFAAMVISSTLTTITPAAQLPAEGDRRRSGVR